MPGNDESTVSEMSLWESAPLLRTGGWLLITSTCRRKPSPLVSAKTRGWRLSDVVGAPLHVRSRSNGRDTPRGPAGISGPRKRHCSGTRDCRPAASHSTPYGREKHTPALRGLAAPPVGLPRRRPPSGVRQLGPDTTVSAAPWVTVSATVVSVSHMNKCTWCGEDTTMAGGWVRVNPRRPVDPDGNQYPDGSQYVWVAGDSEWTCYDCFENAAAAGLHKVP